MTQISGNPLQLLVDKQTSHALASSNAHARQQQLLLGPPQLAQASHDLSGSSGSQRVAESNGASPGVHLGPVQVELVAAVDGHGGKGLVDLNDVNVVEADVVDGEQLGDGKAGANAHDAGGQAGDGRADVLGHDGQAQLDGG